MTVVATADTDLRLTAEVFERVFGETPGCVRHVPGAMTLLGDGRGQGLTIGLPWGVVVALGEGPTDLYSMNHDPGRYTDGEAVPEWAEPALAALHAHNAAGARMVVSRELPFGTGLFDGGETYCAVSQSLHDLYGTKASATRGASSAPGRLTALHARPGRALLVQGEVVESLPCDLAGEGLRLLVMDLGIDRMLPRAEGRLLALTAASALRSGDVAAFGALLTEGHVRGEFVFDLAVDTAQQAGALGGLVIGRCVVALAPTGAVPRIRRSVKAMLSGLARRSPRFLTAVPSGPRTPREDAVTASG